MSFRIYKHKIMIDGRSKIFDFLVDGRKYYVYRITDINTNESYYGSRASKNKDLITDFWGYGTSSKRKHSILNNSINYKLKIIKEFDNYDDMIIYESFLHWYFNVKSHSVFFNEANQTPFGFANNRAGCVLSEVHKNKISKSITGKLNGMFGKTHTLETKKRWSDIRTGVRISEATKEKISQANKGHFVSEATKEKISQANKGHTRNNGSVNGHAKVIEIFNATGDIQHVCVGNFKQICEEYKLPFSALSGSYRTNGKPIWTLSQWSTMAKQRNEDRFIGWYAKIKEKEN